MKRQARENVRGPLVMGFDFTQFWLDENPRRGFFKPIAAYYYSCYFRLFSSWVQIKLLLLLLLFLLVA